MSRRQSGIWDCESLDASDSFNLSEVPLGLISVAFIYLCCNSNLNTHLFNCHSFKEGILKTM